MKINVGITRADWLSLIVQEYENIVGPVKTVYIANDLIEQTPKDANFKTSFVSELANHGYIGMIGAIPVFEKNELSSNSIELEFYARKEVQ